MRDARVHSQSSLSFEKLRTFRYADSAIEPYPLCKRTRTKMVRLGKVILPMRSVDCGNFGKNGHLPEPEEVSMLSEALTTNSPLRFSR